jgi:2',3'-cyclic-nucleotide 2'-phosphodiesterase (5'-nucleotidase family)
MGKKGGYGFDDAITMESLQRMGYDVLVLSDGEVLRGLDTVDSLLGAHGLRSVSNNILDAATGELRYEPFAIVKAGGLKVGVTGMIPSSTILRRIPEKPAGVEVDDGIRRSREVLKAMRKKRVDLAVLAVRGSLAEAQALADSLPGYDVILAGGRRTSRREPEKRGETILAAMDGGCSWIGELNLSVDRRRVVAFGGRSFEMNQDDGPVDAYLKELTYTKLELDEKGERITKAATQEAPKEPAGGA